MILRSPNGATHQSAMQSQKTDQTFNMALLGFYNYGPVDGSMPMPFVDYQHDRTHQHQTLLQHLAHQKLPPSSDQNPNRPDVDIRDALTEYVVEIEVPGVKNTRDFSVKWTSNSSLVIVGVVESPTTTGNNKTQQGGKTQEPSPPPLHPVGGREINGEWEESEKNHQGKSSSSSLVVGERRLGNFRRYINFPVEIDAEAVTAKLEAGLLVLRVPKAQHHMPKHNVSVEIVA